VDGLAPAADGKLRYWIEERGMSGVRCYTGGSTMPESQLWLDKPEAVPFWEEVKRLQIPVAVSTRRVVLPMVHAIVRQYPDTPFLLDHMLQPDVEDGPPFERARLFLDLSQYPNTFLKVTPTSLKNISVGKSTPESFLSVVAERFGVRRMMWGSNFPSSWSEGDNPYHGVLNQTRRAVSFLSEDEQRWFFGGSARSVYTSLRAPVSPTS
jgi:predicted TIM-barrel fold metal-dependent hydrolase